jgi:hypothetical protein
VTTDTSPDGYAELFDAVISVAAAPPATGGRYVVAAKVPWTRITRLRAALDALHIEWRNE